ncbi:MAG: protein BatD, partial [Candidatus Omnitrophica bacterium]|nr:protein BatD [Candidatus Omnitrophota bacterium]
MIIKKVFPFTFLALFSFLAAIPSACAVEPQISLVFQANQSGVGEEMPLTVRVVGAQGNVQAPRIPVPAGVESFYTGRSSNLSFVNGVSSSSVEFSYVLVGRRPGKYNIPAIDVSVGGQIYKSEPLQFEITGNAASAAPMGPQAPAMPTAPQNTGSSQAPVQEPPAAYVPEDTNIYVAASVDKTTVYPNEQVLLTYSLFTRYDTRYEGFGEEPEMSGFWIEEFPPEREIRRETVRVNGKQYVKAEIRQIALFPTAPASYQIKPGTLKASIRQEQQQGSSVFDEFFNDSFFSGSGFFSRRENRLLKPAPIQLTVIPFPEQGKPANFNGAVGNFRMTAAIDQTQVKQNESVTVTIQIEGEGNIETLKQPGIPELENFKVYESDSKSDLFKNGFVIGGKKTFEIVFIPLEAGDQLIPKLSFSFFNPRTRQYQTLFTPAFALKVAVSKETSALPRGLENDAAFKKDIKKEGDDIQYIRDQLGNEKVIGMPARVLKGTLAADLLISLLFVLGLLRIRREEIFSKDTALRRRKYAKQTAMSRMGTLNKYSRSDKPEEVIRFFNELDKVLTQYLSDKFNLSAFGATRHNFENELKKSLGSNHELHAEIAKIYALCEEARYGMGQIQIEFRTQ